MPGGNLTPASAAPLASDASSKRHAERRLSLYVVFIFLTMSVTAQFHAFRHPVSPPSVGGAERSSTTVLASLNAAE